MRIAIVSDIHSNLEALQTVIESFPEHDKLICLGDIVGYGPQPNEVIEQLQRLNPDCVLAGNHDHAVVTGDSSDFSAHAAQAVKWTRHHIKSENLHYLSTLKPYSRIELNQTLLALFHGSPRDPLNEYIFPGIPDPLARRLIQRGAAPIVLLGHTHMPMVYSYEQDMLGNPGSVGQPRDGDARASFAILSLTEERFFFEIRRVEYDVEKVADKIIQAKLPQFLAERLYIGM